MSSLERCPLFRVSCIERFHCIHEVRTYLAEFIHILDHGFFSGHVPTDVPGLPLGPPHVVPEPRLGCVARANGGLLVQGIKLGGGAGEGRGRG